MKRLLPTTVIGSQPKPRWLNYLAKQRTEGHITRDAMEQAYCDSIKAAVKDQETAGVDIIWDGEMRREEMTSYFAEHIGGFRIYGDVRVWGNNYYKKPAIVEEFRYKDVLAVDEYKFLKTLTDREIKVPITGPYTIVDWSYNEYYNTKEDAVYALAGIMNEELKRLSAAGATYIQIDDPALSTHPDEIETAKNSLEIATKGVDAYVGLHICYGDYSRIYPGVLDFPVDQLDFELANKNYADLEIFKQYGFTKDFGFGVVDVHTSRIETVGEIKKNIARSFDIVEPKQVYVDPDCGMKLLPPGIAYEKLRNMCEAARQMRSDLG
ncbi:MAG: methionine synthase [Candidatus Altiarchaeia archaeon]